MLARLPLLIIPLILYNIVMFTGLGGAAGFQGALFTLPMMSGGSWTMTIADLLVLVALFILFIEILKSTRTGSSSVVDHMLSTVVFVLFLVEFLLVSGASTSVFFTLMVITLIDVMAGFSVSIRAAGRDITMS